MLRGEDRPHNHRVVLMTRPATPELNPPWSLFNLIIIQKLVYSYDTWLLVSVLVLVRPHILICLIFCQFACEGCEPWLPYNCWSWWGNISGEPPATLALHSQHGPEQRQSLAGELNRRSDPSQFPDTGWQHLGRNCRVSTQPVSTRVMANLRKLSPTEFGQLQDLTACKWSH